MPQNIDLVLPCYNPSADFVELVEVTFRNLETSFPDRQMHLFVVNDGSTCNFTDKQIQQLCSIQDTVHIISYPCNKGKGYALRKAIAETRSPLVVYTDYDFPFCIETIKKLINELDNGADVVLASRNHDYFRILPVTRRFYSMMSMQMNRLILRLEYYETQGGLKGFNSKGKESFMKTTINGFLFDTEFIYRVSMQKDVAVVNINGITRKGIKPNNIPVGVILKELVNFYRITKLKAL
jgi:glycosyltransferase involved in cell wall biosynthesis